MPWFQHEASCITRTEMRAFCQQLLDEARVRLNRDLCRVLILPPDLTRAHCGAGWIAETIYGLLPKSSYIHLIPTLGQHVPHTDAENQQMFGNVPLERIHVHDWRDGVTRVGTIPRELVAQSTGSRANWHIPVDLNTMLITEPWDLVIHIGHVVPHEVLGFSSHNKNYFIGLGGKDTIAASHLAAAVGGIENNLGQIQTPLRQCYDWAEREFLEHLPSVYFLVTMTRGADGQLVHTGVYAGDDWETYCRAARTSQRQNVTVVDEPVDKLVAVMQADEFRATWVANKAVYRTRMAMADGGELLVIAPGVERFGEQAEVDALIRKYGYCGTARVMDLWKSERDLQDYAHATAHLMHGSSEGRFIIRYAPGKLTRAEIESVHYAYADLGDSLRRYNPVNMREGWNTMPDGERVFFVSSPSTGLWMRKNLRGN